MRFSAKVFTQDFKISISTYAMATITMSYAIGIKLTN